MKTVRASRLIRPGARPGRGRPRLAMLGSSGGGGGLPAASSPPVFVGAGSSSGPSNNGWNSLGTADGDVAIWSYFGEAGNVATAGEPIFSGTDLGDVEVLWDNAWASWRHIVVKSQRGASLPDWTMSFPGGEVATLDLASIHVWRNVNFAGVQIGPQSAPDNEGFLGLQAVSANTPDFGGGYGTNGSNQVVPPWMGSGDVPANYGCAIPLAASDDGSISNVSGWNSTSVSSTTSGNDMMVGHLSTVDASVSRVFSFSDLTGGIHAGALAPPIAIPGAA